MVLSTRSPSFSACCFGIPNGKKNQEPISLKKAYESHTTKEICFTSHPMLNKALFATEAVISQLFSWFPRQISSLVGSMVYDNPALFSPHSSVGKESSCSAGDPGSIPGWGRFPWRRKWQPTPVFLPGESQERGSLAGYSPCSRKSQTRLSD